MRPKAGFVAAASAAALLVLFAAVQLLERDDEPPQFRDVVEFGADQRNGTMLDNSAAKGRWNEWMSRVDIQRKKRRDIAGPHSPRHPGDAIFYLKPAITLGQVDRCREWLADGRGGGLCKLAVLYGEGKIKPGRYSKAQAEALLHGETVEGASGLGRRSNHPNEGPRHLSECLTAVCGPPDRDHMAVVPTTAEKHWNSF